MKFKLDRIILNYMHVLSEITHAKIKDCFLFNDTVYYIVEEGEGGKAIGFKGAFVKKVSSRINKPVKIVEFSKDPVRFINNFLLPIRVDSVSLRDSEIVIHDNDRMKKSKIFGREKANLGLMNALVSRYYHNNYKVVIE